MKIYSLIIFILITFYFSCFSALPQEEVSTLKEKNLEQRIEQNVQRIKESAKLSKAQEVELYSVIKQKNLKIRKEREEFDKLIKEGGKGVIPIIEKCLRDPALHVRKNAISGLAYRVILKGIEYREQGRIENEDNRLEEEAIISIAMRSLSDTDKEIRKYGVITLWNSLKVFKYNPAVIELLKKVMREDEDKEVRESAVLALWEIGEKSAFTEEEWEDLQKKGVRF